MAPRITFIGAGSVGFTRNLVRDILTFPILEGATLALMDVNADRLEMAREAVQAIVDKGNYPAKVVATQDRKEALKGADAVLCTILSGDLNVWRKDIEIPKKFGVDTNVGDTRGPSGIFRFLRTMPDMLDICRDMEKVCPDAILLNYTNPMAMLCRSMQAQTSIKVSGLCHSVQGTSKMLAKWIGAPYEEIDYVCAGINHQAFFVEYKWNGKDAYPLLKKAMKKKKIYNEEQVRNELFIALGYYITESSGHNSEYNWWFRKRPDLIEKYCTHGTGWNPGEYAYIVKHYENRKRTWKKEIKNWLKNIDDFSLERGHEYAASIINAWMGGEPFEFNGNVRNDGVVTNLPDEACVEVPVVANRRGFNKMFVGAMPPQLAAMNNLTIAVEEMAVAGAIQGDPELVYQAICYDPLTASVLSLAEIRKMVNAMLKFNAPFLKYFKSTKI